MMLGGECFEGLPQGEWTVEVDLRAGINYRVPVADSWENKSSIAF